MLCNICKKNEAIIFSSKEENGERKMEGLCIDCAKKQGINTDEILKNQNKAFQDMNIKNMNNQLEGLFKNLAENLGNMDGIEIDAIPFEDMNDFRQNNFDEDQADEDEDEEKSGARPIFAGAIPLGSIFGNLVNFNQKNASDNISSNGNIKKIRYFVLF